jgi:hypothetical protein
MQEVTVKTNVAKKPTQFGVSSNYQPQFWWCSKYARPLEGKEVVEKHCRENGCSYLLRAWTSNYCQRF